MLLHDLIRYFLATETNWIQLDTNEVVVGVNENFPYCDVEGFLSEGGLIMRDYIIPSLSNSSAKMRIEITFNPREEVCDVCLYIHDPERPELVSSPYSKTFSRSELHAAQIHAAPMLKQWLSNGVNILKLSHGRTLTTTFEFDAMNAWVSESVMVCIDGIKEWKDQIGYQNKINQLTSTIKESLLEIREARLNASNPTEDFEYDEAFPDYI